MKQPESRPSHTCHPQQEVLQAILFSFVDGLWTSWRKRLPPQRAPFEMC